MSLSKTQTAPVRKSPKKRRLEVLTRRTDFVQTFTSGRRVRPCEWLFFNFAIGDRFRCGWTVPRAVGPAVVRNKLKRWCRMWLRAKLAESEVPAVDLNIGFKAMSEDFYQRMSYAQFASVMETGWARLAKAVKGSNEVSR